MKVLKVLLISLISFGAINAQELIGKSSRTTEARKEEINVIVLTNEDLEEYVGGYLSSENLRFLDNKVILWDDYNTTKFYRKVKQD